MNALVPLAVGYTAGSIPFSNLVARATADVDLRDVETGTVSGTSLYRVAGFLPMVVGGLLDVGKGAVGPLLAVDRPLVAALAGGLALVGHNWSPLLRGHGGRGISPAMGALAVLAWPGTVLLLAGLAFGRLAGHTGLGSFLAQAALAPLLGWWQGWYGGMVAASVLLPLWAKRLTGNRTPERPGWRPYLSRLLFDHDEALRAEERPS